MRLSIFEQLPLLPAFSSHIHGRELAAMGELLDRMPDELVLVHNDLLAGKPTSPNGRPGLTADQVLRTLVAKQMNGWSYNQMAFYLSDSQSYQAFCRVPFGNRAFSRAALQQNIKRLRPETIELINRKLLKLAGEDKIESGRKVRVDCTAIEANVHEPSDSSLLADWVRVVCRLLGQGAETFGLVVVDHTRRARRRALGILNAKSVVDREGLYRDLLRVTRMTQDEARRAVVRLELWEGSDPDLRRLAVDLAEVLTAFLAMCEKLIEQTETRVFRGETTPAAEKILSVFEPHTDIIIKDRRDIVYGHKVCLTTGASSLILDCVILDGNPADSTLAVPMVARLKEIFGRVPRQVAFDGGFASRANLETIREMEVQDVAFSKRRGIEISQMARSSWVYKRLRDFRAGIEGGISFLKRCFGWDRCNWSGLPSFKAYVWSSVLTANLLILARHQMAAAEAAARAVASG